MHTPTVAANQSAAEEFAETMDTPAIPASQSEPEEVPETVETLPFQPLRANQRRS